MPIMLAKILSSCGEIKIDQDIDYPKYTKNISYIQPIRNYTVNTFKNCDIDINEVKESPIIPIIPPWEHLKANILVDYTSYTKKDNANIVSSIAKLHIHENFDHHLKIYTDGSVSTSGVSGFGFFIPSLNVKKSYYLGKGFSIYTSELCAILAALDFILEIRLNIY